jgi:hypothetical protein
VYFSPGGIGGFRQAILEDDADAIALIDLDRRARAAAVVAPRVDGFKRRDFAFHNFGREAKHFHVAVEFEREIGNVRSNDARTG